jgi:hypothetical protein
MHTRPSPGRPVELATPATPGAGLLASRSEADRAAPLLLTVWGGRAGPWRARIELAGVETHDFDSPFELARFLMRLTDRRVRSADPVAGGGLR